MSISPDLQSTPGVVELREDVPLQPHSDERLCAAGPRLILVAFAALSAAITLALLTQIYYGDYEVVPHGSVSTSAAECSRAGTAALRAGGRALDAAVAAALCLALVAPHRTSLDASGALVYWEYRTSRWTAPTLAEWGGPEGAQVQVQVQVAGNATAPPRPPRLVSALAALHARLGVAPWPSLLQPAIDLARSGFLVSEGLATAAAFAGGLRAAKYQSGALLTEPHFAGYLESLQLNSSAELCAAWQCTDSVQWWAAGAGAASAGTEGAEGVEGAAGAGVGSAGAEGEAAGRWRVWGGGAGGELAAYALHVALDSPPPDAAAATDRVVRALQQQLAAAGRAWPAGVASGLAVVDPRDTYAAFVTGLSKAFGSGEAVEDGGWSRDEPTESLDLAPAIIVDENVCGTRYVIGAESGAALAQAAAAALAGGDAGAGGAGGAAEAAEGARLAVAAGGLALEAARPPPALALPQVLQNATPPYAAVNLIQQRGDALLSHADSRGGGLASRF